MDDDGIETIELAKPRSPGSFLPAAASARYSAYLPRPLHNGATAQQYKGKSKLTRPQSAQPCTGQRPASAQSVSSAGRLTHSDAGAWPHGMLSPASSTPAARKAPGTAQIAYELKMTEQMLRVAHHQVAD